MMSTGGLADLHEPYAPLLRAALAALSPGGARRALDLGCGPGLKAGWLAERLAPGGLLIGLDRDRGALAGAGAPLLRLAGDAHDLPLAAATIDLAWGVAVLGLLADPARALAELGRVLRPGGVAVLSLAGQRWACRRPWPAALAAALAGCASAPLRPADGLGDELPDGLTGAGLAPCGLRAYDLSLAAAGPLAAALPLADWAALRPLAAPRLAPADLAACEAIAAESDPEPVDVLLVAAARRAA